MGKGTDKLYITHSEWSSEDQFSASAGSGLAKARSIGASFRRLPYNFCAVSLQPFQHPVCTSGGIIFDLTNILPWLKKHGTNPVDGTPLKSNELIKLKFAKNEDDEYVDPVTFKPFTDNTHIVALRNSGNVFSWDTIERLNVKTKNWRDLVSDDEFSRKDIITLQDPQHLESRDLNSFKYLKDGVSTLTPEQEQEHADPTNNLNLSAMGNAARILHAKEAVAKSRAVRAAGINPNNLNASKTLTTAKPIHSMAPPLSKSAPPSNAAIHTSGRAAASFTSTGLTPHTAADLALLSEEEYLLKPRRVKIPGYARIQTTQGPMTIELHTEFAPRAVWNFVSLAKRGYYRGVSFHRNIRNFMIQGGDPTGSGRGGESIWKKPFVDEWAQSPLTHDARGVMSMANKGKNTNTSQFFVTYRATAHLDRKHTIFGRVLLEEPEAAETLKRLEAVPTGKEDRPAEECMIEDVVVYVDPFEEFRKNEREQDEAKLVEEEIKRQGGTEDDKMTWTGKRVRGVAKDGAHAHAGAGGSSVGKYLDAAISATKEQEEDEIIGEVVEEEWEASAAPPSKKRKAGGFGNFDAW